MYRYGCENTAQPALEFSKHVTNHTIIHFCWKYVNKAKHTAARKLLVCKAHRSGQGEGDLTIVEPHARSNAADDNFRRRK